MDVNGRKGSSPAAAVSAAYNVAEAWEKTYNTIDYSIRKAESTLGSFGGLQDALTATVTFNAWGYSDNILAFDLGS